VCELSILTPRRLVCAYASRMPKFRRTQKWPFIGGPVAAEPKIRFMSSGWLLRPNSTLNGPTVGATARIRWQGALDYYTCFITIFSI
jgi:hypothetical protein